MEETFNAGGVVFPGGIDSIKPYIITIAEVDEHYPGMEIQEWARCLIKAIALKRNSSGDDKELIRSMGKNAAPDRDFANLLVTGFMGKNVMREKLENTQALTALASLVGENEDWVKKHLHGDKEEVEKLIGRVQNAVNESIKKGLHLAKAGDKVREVVASVSYLVPAHADAPAAALSTPDPRSPSKIGTELS